MRKSSLFIFILQFCVAIAQAQISEFTIVNVDSTIHKLNMMTAEEYANIVLPPLEVLYENARNAASVRYFTEEADYFMSDVKSQRRKPWDWVRLVGTYSYGNIDMAAITLSQSSYQVWTQNNSTQTQSYYNVGATLSVPIGDIINKRNKVKQAWARYEQSKSKEKAELDAIRVEIVKLYESIVSTINVLKVTYEQYLTAHANYVLYEMQFTNNKADSFDLSRTKEAESNALRLYEETRARVNEDLLHLEIISCTRIVSKDESGETLIKYENLKSNATSTKRH